MFFVTCSQVWVVSTEGVRRNDSERYEQWYG